MWNRADALVELDLHSLVRVLDIRARGHAGSMHAA
jgi:hypothetical protein